METVAILLAAGASQRFGIRTAGGKLTALYRGKPLYRHALDALSAVPLIRGILVVVTDRFPIPSTRPTAGAPRRFIVNPESDKGMGASIRAAVLAAPEDAGQYLIALADMPHVRPELVVSLVELQQQRRSLITLPLFEGNQGHPVLIGAELRPELLELHADLGARDVIARHTNRIAHLDTQDSGVMFDIDTVADFERGEHLR